MRTEIQNLVNAIESRLYGTGVTVQAHDVSKNNDTVRSAITVMPNDGEIAKIVYVDEILDMMEKGEIDSEEAVDEFEEVYRRTGKEILSDAQQVAEIMREGKNCILNHVTHQIVNKKWNEGTVGKLAHREYLDFMVLYTVSVGSCSTKLTSDFISVLGITVEELEDAAKKNWVRERYEVQSISEALSELGLPIHDKENDVPMYVMTNRKMMYGAAIILYEQYLDELAQELGKDLYIIPSSIHEVLAVPAMGCKEPLDAMIQEVNATEAHAEENLSDHVYIYKRNTKKLEIA